MNGTPRRGPGGFPATPQTHRSPAGGAGAGTGAGTGSTPSRPNVRAPPLAEVPRTPAAQPSAGPLIPSHILDPAQQRFYLFAFYVALWAWRSYDFYNLAIEEDQSLVLCLKWCFLDMCFIFGVPVLEIPWLEYSNATAFLLFLLHAVMDVMLMFRIGVPVQAWALSLLGFLWDSELAISERSVKPGPILHNASLILGKQIVNILPEGSAILNPDKLSFCLNSSVTSLELPIQINQTEPVEIDLLRIDIDTNQNETIKVKSRELKGLLKTARKAAKGADPAEPITVHYRVKKRGVYLLRKVLDQSQLEVRPRSSSVVVASCPQARVKPTGGHRCRNDLSDVALEVEGIPPLNIKYRLTVNDKARGGSEFHNLQPDEFTSPLSRHTSQALVKSGHEDVSWAKSQKVTVPLNETLLTSGRWAYEVEEVRDALGNVVNYLVSDDDERPKARSTGIQQSFQVHERPKTYVSGCDLEKPLRVAKGNVQRFPLVYSSTGKEAIDAPHHIEYMFTPEADMPVDGSHSPNAEIKQQTIRTNREQPLISASGLYTVTSVKTEFCAGDVLEPTSCLLQNPPEPELTIESTDIVDKCAGNPIGLRVSLDFVGTPPFEVTYTEKQDARRAKKINSGKISSVRSTIDLTPPTAGHYTYVFDTIKDEVYGERPLENLVLQQNVKPSVSAHYIETGRPKEACIDDTAEFDVRLQGEGPWNLEYEVTHNGKRKKHSVDIEEEHYTIKTEALTQGGEHTVSLASVTDKMGCKEYLKESAKVIVRHDRPKAYFGQIEGKQAVMALEGKNVELPLHLTGSGRWFVEYENLDTNEVLKTEISSRNSFLKVKSEGTYQLIKVHDAVCPGVIDPKAGQFSVGWVPRPKLSVDESATMVLEGGKYIKEAVCEGEEDAFEVTMSGNPPFEVAYGQEYREKNHGKKSSVSNKPLRALAGSASIRAETSQSGVYDYIFRELADSKYDHSSKHFSPVTVQQTVYPRPGARFDKPGKTYSYCSRETDGEEVIPMTFDGVPPFYLEIEIKHHGTPKPEISVHKNIPSNKYDLKIEHRKLHLGHSAISIRKIRDARGCTLKPPPGGPRVQISVHDAPTATPLEDRTDFCVGDRLSFALGGQVPFTVYYTFEKDERKASNAGTTFRRLAERPGTFTITGLRDSASECLAPLNMTKHIHAIPSVRLSGGQLASVDIHEGGGTDLEFQFTGDPPFEFTYTRSSNAGKGRKSRVLEMRTEVSHELALSVAVQEEGTYEVVSIKDRWCGFARGGRAWRWRVGVGRGRGGRSC
ncbi:hypothetical protein BDV95DRAFT_544826 [Massariosphaeria phaeospora]|uniref:Nucleoporin Pom152 n=1 Tax=Massariosphaeria phaeospora TaxID=100035 RepID=A0A7C8M5F6_9PLEO|nr:hypothetical protein BDV95DRAFT_544826 [Massariosphaeria phaeospora]